MISKKWVFFPKKGNISPNTSLQKLPQFFLVEKYNFFPPKENIEQDVVIFLNSKL
jgi:hypothetical protein